MLYMATTDSIKFKAKSWIDVFGGRASKAVGSLVTNTFKKPVENLMFYGSMVSFFIAAALLLIAAMLGSTFEKLSATVRLAAPTGSARRVAYPNLLRGVTAPSARAH